MPRESQETCTHIDQLKPKPSPEDLSVLRKGLRKRKPPAFELERGEHKRLGKFLVTRRDGDIFIEWSINERVSRLVSLADLNLKPEHEADRLEVGWLIASMYQLDGIHNCADVADLREIMKMMQWYGRHEDAYRHWALVPAGHMKLEK